jgi:hypothetical protein
MLTVCSEAPVGLGEREDVWWAVERPSRVFLDALASFEQTGQGEQAVIDAGVKLRAAWQRAAGL